MLPLIITLGSLFVVYLLIEISALSYLANHLGGYFLFLWIAASALAGIFLLRRQRIGFARIINTFGQSGSLSIYQLLWPFRYGLSAILLIAPGVLSDLVALLLLLPFRGDPKIHIKANQTRSPNHSTQKNTATIEGEYQEIDEVSHKK